MKKEERRKLQKWSKKMILMKWNGGKRYFDFPENLNIVGNS